MKIISANHIRTARLAEIRPGDVFKKTLDSDMIYMYIGERAEEIKSAGINFNCVTLSSGMLWTFELDSIVYPVVGAFVEGSE